MKQLSLFNRLAQLHTTQRQLFFSAQRVFSTVPPSDEEKRREEFLKKERAHFESLSDRDKAYYQAFRLSLMKSMEEQWKDGNNWWNKIAQMKEEEIDVLPNEYLRKFGGFLVKTEEL